MNTDQKLRIKSAMIVYELETALGNYVIDNEILDNISDKCKNTIIQREKEKGNNRNYDNISFLVESSYLDEVFNLAIETTEGTTLSNHMKLLKELCCNLGIFEIRNSISHPNRPFPDCYWYRAATIASDPLIAKLGLGSVRQALNSANEGNLNAPPEDWYTSVKWAIPNTLPNSFDHEITGLVGRDKEFKDLESTLSKARNNLIAVVAPGGIGKTALILQYLKEISLSPTWSQSINSIIFCTLKNERLTANGIELIEAINGMDQIKESILNDLNLLYGEKTYNSFEDACEKLENEKILICIDNLETLLVCSQTEFIEFNQSLPVLWRIIVTSRISVDSATTVPIDSLVKRHAINLCRSYLRKRGVSDFKQTDIEKIAEVANNNPLAIRLTIDLYIKGGDISQSINKSQKDIASFSYKNLIESLQPNSISILEAIYVIGNSTKSELIEFLDLSNEDIAESLNELSKTSLIVRTTSEFGHDSYNLSDSIRDLLLTNPKNIEVRSKISESLKKRKAKILEQTTRNKQLGLTKFDDEYVDSKTDSSTHALIVDLNRYFSRPYLKRNHSELIELKSRFADSIIYNTNNLQLKFHYSRILNTLKDNTGELNILTEAKGIKPDSPRILISIAKHHFHNNDYDLAIKIFKELINKGYNIPNNSSNKYSYTVTKLYLLCHLYLGKFDELISFTENWKSDENWSVLYGTYRASAFKRKIEHKRHTCENNAKSISQILDIFHSIFENGDYPKVTCYEVNKQIKEFIFILNRNSSYTKAIITKYITFIADHYFNVVSRLENENIDSQEIQNFLKTIYNYNISKNPLHHVKWFVEKTDEVYDKDHIEELISEGFEIVEVYHIPERENGLSNYIFAQNDKGNQFYLSVYCFESGWNRWGYIKMNSKLAIKFERLLTNGKSTPATDIVEIDQYEI